MKRDFSVYTVCHKASVMEHGGGWSYDVIQRTGSYGSGEFPPLFLSRNEAEAYNQSLGHSGGKVVELFVSFNYNCTFGES